MRKQQQKKNKSPTPRWASAQLATGLTRPLSRPTWPGLPHSFPYPLATANPSGSLPTRPHFPSPRSPRPDPLPLSARSGSGHEPADAMTPSPTRVAGAAPSSTSTSSGASSPSSPRASHRSSSASSPSTDLLVPEDAAHITRRRSHPRSTSTSSDRLRRPLPRPPPRRPHQASSSPSLLAREDPFSFPPLSSLPHGPRPRPRSPGAHSNPRSPRPRLSRAASRCRRRPVPLRAGARAHSASTTPVHRGAHHVHWPRSRASGRVGPRPWPPSARQPAPAFVAAAPAGSRSSCCRYSRE